MKSVRQFFALFLLGLLASCTKDNSENVQTVTIGGLFSITGNWSSLGKTSKEALNLALVDANVFLEESGSPYRLSSIIYDTQLDTSSSKSSIQRGFSQNNVKIFIGPQSSAELGAIRQYATDNGILVVSQGSTASSLAIPNDGIFRFCPGDVVEGTAIANSVYSSGKRVLITLARNDAGNIGLQNAVGAHFQNLGGTVEAIAPYATSITNYSSLLLSIKNKIQQYSATPGLSKVGVYIASFDECKDLFKQASADPVFASVNWYGGDGVVQSAALLSDTTARNFAVATSFFAPNFGLPMQPHPNLSEIVTGIQSLSGIDPDAYALSVYDAMWVIARTLSNHPGVLSDYSKMKTAFSEEANSYYGITGATLLNENGDRNIGSFDYWGIVNDAGVYRWAIVGKSF